MSTVEAGPAAAAAVAGGVSEKAPQRGVRAVIQTVVSKIIIQGLNAGTGIITARTLMPSGRGQLAAMILWSSFLASMSSFGVPSSIIYTYRHRPAERETIVGTGMLMSLLTGLLATVVGIFFLPHWMHQYPPSVIRSAQWFLLITPICSVTFAGKAVLEAAGSFSSSNTLQILTPAATIVPLVVLWATHTITPFSAALCYIAASLPTFYYMLVRLRPYAARLKGQISTATTLLSFGLRSYGIDLLGALAFQVDQVLVINMLTPAEMGSYVVVLSLSRMLNVFQNSVVTVLFPKASGHPAETVLRLSERSARVGTLVTAVFALFVYVFGPIVLRVLYGKEYTSALGSLRTLLVEVTLAGCVFVLAQAFMALGRPGIVTILQAVGLSLSIPLMIVLIPKWGIQGAAVSLLASTIARFVFVMAGFPIFLKTRMPSLMPRMSDFDDLRSMWRLRKAAQA